MSRRPRLLRAIDGLTRPVSYDRRMCLICVEFDRGRMTIPEARRAIGEMRAKFPTDHEREVEEKLEAAEKEKDSNAAP